MDDIAVTIPAGAIPPGVTAHIELGVTLYGPFVFPKDYQPVSPIIWLCIKEKIKLSLPIVVRLPHMIEDVNMVRLSFAKANHEYGYDSVQNKEVYFFEHLTDGESTFTNPTEDCGKGILCIDHCCLYCSVAKISPILARSKGYCLHTLIESKSPSQCRIVHVCTFFLRQCFKVRIINS